MTIQAEINSRL